MNITLPAEQERWLKGDDMAWAKPLVDEARAAVARGDKFSLEDAELDIDRVLASLKP